MIQEDRVTECYCNFFFLLLRKFHYKIRKSEGLLFQKWIKEQVSIKGKTDLELEWKYEKNDIPEIHSMAVVFLIPTSDKKVLV